MQNDRPIQEFSLQLKTKLESLEDLLAWFESIALKYLSDQAYWQCQLALTEGFTNAVRHAHKNLPATTPIDLKVLLFDRVLEIQVWDCGQPFDLEAELQTRLEQKAYKLDGNLVELTEGGRGLVWMHELMDDLTYYRTPNHRNCLILRKHR